MIAFHEIKFDTDSRNDILFVNFRAQYNTDERTVKFDSLTPGKKYTIKVISVKDHKKSNPETLVQYTSKFFSSYNHAIRIRNFSSTLLY